MDKTGSKPKVVAVVPCYNEQKKIYEVATKALKYVDSIIVVNDGSQDQTEKEARRAGALVINHPCNLGKGVAINTAFEWLRNSDCDCAVFLDGDGQHDPDEIPVLVKPVLAGNSDMVIGSRFINGSNKIPAYRKLGQTVLNMTTNLGSRVKVTDSQSGYRSFSRKAIEIMRFREIGLSVESEMQFLAAKYNLNVGEVAIEVLYEDRPKRNPAVHGFSVLFRVFSLTKSYRLNY